MEVRFKPDGIAPYRARIQEWPRDRRSRGRPLSGYAAEIAEVHKMLDGRYDDIKSGRVEPIDGEVFFDDLHQREDQLFEQRPPK
jgi:hypothetical protein